jgi:thioredoxin reductase (NADPH)
MLPLVVLPDHRRLECPSFRELADAIGLQTTPSREVYDVVIVGGGPAGLAAAVYGASEGFTHSPSSALHAAAKRERRRASRTTSAFPRGFPATSSVRAHDSKPCALARSSWLRDQLSRSSQGPRATDGSHVHSVELEDGSRLLANAVILATAFSGVASM